MPRQHGIAPALAAATQLIPIVDELCMCVARPSAAVHTECCSAQQRTARFRLVRLAAPSACVLHPSVPTRLSARHFGAYTSAWPLCRGHCSC